MHVVHSEIERPDAEIMARFAAIKTEVLAQLPQALLCDPAIRPIAQRDWRITGPALTVASTEADTLMAIGAVGIARPGDILVVAAGGDCSMAVWGGGLTRSARVRHCGGVVVDGATIDTSSMLDAGVPVFSRSCTLRHRVGRSPGSINVPVMFGGVEVMPGDLIVGDDDGVLVLPRGCLPDVIDEAERKNRIITNNAARIRDEGITLFELRGGRDPYEALGIAWHQD